MAVAEVFAAVLIGYTRLLSSLGVNAGNGRGVAATSESETSSPGDLSRREQYCKRDGVSGYAM